MIRTLALFLLLAASVPAVVVEWHANPEPNVAGYRVYVGTESRIYTQVFDVTTTNCFIANSNLVLGTNYFAVTAYDTDGLESEFSEEVYWVRTRLSAPEHLRLKTIATNQTLSVILQQSADFSNWNTVATVPLPIETNAANFFRTATP